MIKQFTIVSLSVLLGGFIYSQNEEDVARFSKMYHGGSARYMAMGGAFGALGADISAVQGNPAALGRFSNSSISLTLSPSFNSVNTTFQGNTSSKTRASFSIPNVGIVLTQDISEESDGNLYSQIGIGYNRIQDYNQKANYEGEQFESLLEEFAFYGEGVNPYDIYYYYPFTTALAYESYALDYNDSANVYTHHLNSGDMLHSREMNSKGGAGEFFVSYSRNRLNKLYWGVSVGIRNYNYESDYTHTEAMADTSGTNFRGFDYSYQFNTEGTGINIKCGILYLVNNQFRVGAAFHTPTYISFTDEWSANMTTRFADTTYTIADEYVPVGNYKYNMLTPLRVQLSSAYIFGTKGLISVEAEYLNYNQGRLSTTNDSEYETSGVSYDFQNQLVKERLASAINIKVGAEYNIQQQFFFRAGFAMYSNAFKKEFEVESAPDIFLSGGIGYQFNQFKFDLSYVNLTKSRTYYAFYRSKAAQKISVNSVQISASLRF